MKILIAFFFLSLSACMSTKIILDKRYVPSSPPAYVDYVDSYWFGFSGHPEIDVQKACVDQKPLAVQRIKTVEDGIITFFTLGIYTPSTVKVWCGQ